MSELQRCGLPIRGAKGQSNGLKRHFQSLSGPGAQWLAVGWPFRGVSLDDHNERGSSRLLELHARSCVASGIAGHFIVFRRRGLAPDTTSSM
jgi:hypothetical protein